MIGTFHGVLGVGRRLRTMFAIVVGCGLLVSCMASERPMFTQASAAQPLKAGTYTAFEREDGAFKAGDTMELRLRGDGRYDFVDEKGDITPVSLHRLAGSRFVAQAEVASGDTFKGFGYLVLDVSGDEALVYAADCDKQDKERMTSLGVEVLRYECRIDRVADPQAFFAGLTFGEPTSKLVRK